jgi:hypothetical protein
VFCQTSTYVIDFAKSIYNKLADARSNTTENMGLWTSWVDEGLNEESHWDCSGAVIVPHTIKFENTTIVLYHKATMTISWSMTGFNWPGRQSNVRITQKYRFIRHHTMHIKLSQIVTSHYKWRVRPSPPAIPQICESNCSWTATNIYQQALYKTENRLHAQHDLQADNQNSAVRAWVLNAHSAKFQLSK